VVLRDLKGVVEAVISQVERPSRPNSQPELVLSVGNVESRGTYRGIVDREILRVL
jgi:hypothetical protein